jgi:hypothetical protein
MQFPSVVGTGFDAWWVHDFFHPWLEERILREHASLSAGKRRLAPVAWVMSVLWFWFAVAPGAVIGDWIFGEPNDPPSWWLGIPSIWSWQIVGWGLGVALMWFLAYRMEMATLSGPALPAERDAAISHTFQVSVRTQSIFDSRCSPCGHTNT